MPHQLHPLRKRIDRLDDQIVTLLLRRFDLARKIGAIKASSGSRVYDPRREREVLARICAHKDVGESKTVIRAIYRCIMSESRRHQIRYARKA